MSLIIREDFSMIDEDIINWETWQSDDIGSGQNVPVIVEHIKLGSYNDYYEINNELRITRRHPMFIKSNGIWLWKDAEFISVGDIMLGIDSEEIVINSCNYINGPLNTVELDVETVDNYFAGTNKVLVHNGVAK